MKKVFGWLMVFVPIIPCIPNIIVEAKACPEMVKGMVLTGIVIGWFVIGLNLILGEL